MRAEHIMERRFVTLRRQDSLDAAVQAFFAAERRLGRKVFGMMVVDETERLVGMLSMYDILVFVQPKHIAVWSEVKEADFSRLFDATLEKARSVRVEDLMTTELVTVAPDTHVLAVADRMIRRHVRRVPVVQDGKVVGIVYISALFRFLLERFRATQG